MVRPDDLIWEYAEKLKQGNSTVKKFKCKYCGTEFTGGATRAKRHLTKETCGDIKPCNEVPEHVIGEIKEAIRDHEEKNKRKKMKTDTQVQRSGNTSHANQGDQPSVNAKLAKFLFLNNIPFDVVEKPSFKEFMESAVKLGIDYELPSLSMLRSHGGEDAIAQYTKDIEECLVETGCTLIGNTVDGINALVIYLWTPKGLLFKANLHADCTCLTPEGLIGLYTVKLHSIVKSLGRTHIVQFTCDDIWGEIYSQLCKSERTVNCTFSMISDIMFHIRTDISYRNVTDCASMIFLYINNNSSINLTLGNEHERGKESDVSSSKFVLMKNGLMSSKELANLVIIVSRLKSLLVDQDAVMSELSKQSSEAKYARFVYLAIHCKEFWSRAKKLVKLLEPLLEAFCLVACQGGTIGYLSQSIHRAGDVVEEYKRVEDEYELLDKVEIFDLLFKEWYRTHPICDAAAILDPAYMLAKSLEGENISDKWCHYFDNLVKDSDKERFRDEFGAYCSKNSNIFTPSAHEKLRTLHPGEWWELFGHSVPVLQKYALWIVMQPCTSYFFTDDELRSIVEDETEGQFRTRKLMMDRSSKLKATRLDDILIEAYEFALRKGTNLPGYKSFVARISGIDEGFWNASREPNFQFLDNWPLPDFQNRYTMSP